MTKPTGRKKISYDPPLEEIERVAAEIREGWSDKVYKQRAGVSDELLEFHHQLHVTHDVLNQWGE